MALDGINNHQAGLRTYNRRLNLRQVCECDSRQMLISAAIKYRLALQEKKPGRIAAKRIKTRPE